MGKIAIGHNNLVDDSGVTITHSTESAGFTAENVQAPQPSQVFRTAVLDPGWVKFVWAAAKRYQLVAVVGAKVSAWANRVLQADDLTTTWAATNLGSIGAPTLSTSGPEGAGFLLDDGVVAGVEHYASIALTDMLDDAEEHGVVVAVSWYSISSSPQFRLHHAGATSGTDYADFDMTTPSSPSVTTSGAGVLATNVRQWTGAYTNWYECSMLVDTAADASRSVRIQMLHPTTGAASYDGSVKLLYVSGIKVAPSASSSLVVPAYYPTTTIPGAAWRISDAGSGATAFLPFSVNGNDATLDSASTYHLYSSLVDGTGVEIEIHDESNANSQIDIGRVFIGPIWQPQQHTFVDLQVNWSPSGKFRIWTIGLGQQITEDEIWGELHELARTVKITSSSLLTETPSGQLIAPDGAKPIVVILDPDETDNPQMLYGFVVALNAQRSAPINVSGTLTEMFSVQIEVWEAIA